MEIVVTVPSVVRPGCGTAAELVPAAGWHPTELFHVDVDELAGAVTFVADRDGCGSVQVREPRQALPSKDRVDRRARIPQLRPQPVGPELQTSTPPHDPPNLAGSQRVRATVGSRGSILQPGRSFLAEPPEPLMGGRPGDPHRLGRCGDGPPFLQDPRDEQEPAERGE